MKHVPVFITLEAYFDFFSDSFLNNSLSTGIGRLERVLRCVIRTSMKVLSFFPYRPMATFSLSFSTSTSYF